MSDASTWAAIKHFALGCAPQWWCDMLMGRALRTRVLGVDGDWRKCTPDVAVASILRIRSEE